jgi:hypothetical protein
MKTDWKRIVPIGLEFTPPRLVHHCLPRRVVGPSDQLILLQDSSKPGTPSRQSLNSGSIGDSAAGRSPSNSPGVNGSDKQPGFTLPAHAPVTDPPAQSPV